MNFHEMLESEKNAYNNRIVCLAIDYLFSTFKDLKKIVMEVDSTNFAITHINDFDVENLSWEYSSVSVKNSKNNVIHYKTERDKCVAKEDFDGALANHRLMVGAKNAVERVTSKPQLTILQDLFLKVDEIFDEVEDEFLALLETLYPEGIVEITEAGLISYEHD